MMAFAVLIVVGSIVEYKEARRSTRTTSSNKKNKRQLSSLLLASAINKLACSFEKSMQNETTGDTTTSIRHRESLIQETIERITTTKKKLNDEKDELK